MTMQGSAFLKRLAAGVTRYRLEDRDALLAFRRSIIEDARTRSTPEFFEWQFEQNLVARDASPQLWIYRKDGRIVGQQGGVPVELKVGDRRFRGSWAIDLHVESAFRLRGIGVALSETYVSGNDITMALGITDDARKAFLRAGWIDLGAVPLFVRPLRTGRMLGTRGHGALGKCAGFLADIPLRCVETAARAGLVLRSFRLQGIDRFDELADRIWERAAEHYPAICRRDRAHLNWRYADFPLEGTYRCFYLLRHETVVGLVVLRMGARHGVPAGYVVDYLCEPQWTTALFAACVQRFRQWGASAVYCLHDGPWVARSLRRLGFVRRESTTRLMFRPPTANGESKPVGKEVIALLSDSRNWFVTMGDSDADGAMTEGRAC